MDLIERKAALYALCEDCKSKYDGLCPHEASKCIEYRAINRLPAIEAEPVRHGRWETWGYVFHGIEWKRCSCCGNCADVSYYGLLDGEIRMSTPAICGCCGARMNGGDDNEHQVR